MAQKKKRLVFDIETKPFSELFRDAETDGDRRLHAPRLRVACVYDEAVDAYRYYTVRRARKMVEDLLSADGVITNPAFKSITQDAGGQAASVSYARLSCMYVPSVRIPI